MTERVLCGNPTDARDDERDRFTLDQGSASFDPDLLGVGSTYYDDATSSRVFVPETATGEVRYLFRLAAIACAEGDAIRIRGLRQAVGIGVLLKSDDEENPSEYPLEMDQVSPFWHFSDGNISWGLRAIYGPTPQTRWTPEERGPGNAADYASGTDASRLVTIKGNAAVDAPARGFFPGRPIGGLGLFRDLRFPWRTHSAMGDVDIEIPGPVTVGLFCSVRQTNPRTRQQLTPLLPQGFIPPVPEDAFLVEAERAQIVGIRYRHVSGAIIASIGPISRVPGYNLVQGRSPP